MRPGRESHRGGTLTVLTADSPPSSLDTAVGYTVFHGFGLTNDGLTTWKRVGGQEGSQIVANLATAIPQPTDGGRRYTFRLRHGVRYSSGELVRAEDFRRALERVYALTQLTRRSTAQSAIPPCRKRPRACDLSRSIMADNTTGTITFRLKRPDPDLPAKLALGLAAAVPAHTPIRDLHDRPLPATGPYMIASYAPGRRIRLVRNPRFRVWSQAARPDGYPDEIVLKYSVPIPAQIAAVSKGDADVADLTFGGADEIAPLRPRFGSRLHSDPGPLVNFTFLNSRMPPFDDVRVRRALNLAVDREAVVRSFGGPARASPACQTLPSNYQGYQPYCPYERDLDEAQELVTASETRGQAVVVLTRTSYVRYFTHVIAALRTLGYQARLRVVDDVGYYDELAKLGPAHVQAGHVGWIAAIPSPAEYMQSLLDFLAGNAGFADKDIQREIEHALLLQQSDVAEANDTWARVDRMLVEKAYLVPLFNPSAVGFVSERVGNYQLHLFFYFLLDQMWVR